jgi:phenylacetate-CoA ligase
MDLYQRILRDVLLPLDSWRTGDSAQWRYLREFERTQWLPASELRAYQWALLRRLLAHAYERCPFYRERFEAVGLLPADLRGLDDLAAFPVLEKCDIQCHRDAMVAEGWPREDLIANQTGGSTGRPLSFYLSLDRKLSRAAGTVRHNRWAGWDVGDKVAMIWGAPRDRPLDSPKARLRNLLLDRQLFLDTAQFTEAKLSEFHKALKRFQPKVILAYARGAVVLARYLKSRGLSAYQPYSLVTSAEVLEPTDRALVSEVFGCPVFDRYGCREVSVLASECAQHHGLHTMAEGLYVEVVRGDVPALPSEEGSILVTDLRNLAMPLIRYRIGDVGSFESDVCPCGRGLPRIRAVSGRVTDFLTGSDGRLVSGVFLATYVVAQRPSLGQVQIHQEEPHRVLYRIHRGRSFHDPDDLIYLAEQTRHYLGEAMSVEYEFVDALEPEPSGKFLFCRSNVMPSYLTEPEQPTRAAS